ncbi:DUF3846 domain-containing protein [[Clostridium] fimetarium]|uniref:DUF3846 domain-containing protein n=1 Tax=[Clostridium] fimetarium TaxID=99656 RepID=A0A1I0RDV2_9FIRM|nr:DUF3846 domain-containing protein [[Clostridium] fimetarium]SEW38924.1 protein of unknown function [[Clostridium] fimetarium]
MADKIKIYSLEERQEGYIKEVEDSLESFQKEVGGYIEIVCLDDKADLDLFVNEEGKIRGLTLNRAWLNKEGDIIEIICGNGFVARHDKDGNTTSILESDISFINDTLLPILIYSNGSAILQTKEGEVIHAAIK